MARAAPVLGPDMRCCTRKQSTAARRRSTAPVAGGPGEDAVSGSGTRGSAALRGAGFHHGEAAERSASGFLGCGQLEFGELL